MGIMEAGLEHVAAQESEPESRAATPSRSGIIDCLPRTLRDFDYNRYRRRSEFKHGFTSFVS